MEDLEKKLDSVLSDPQMMQKIMTLAQSLGGQSSSDPTPSPSRPDPLPALDPGMLQKLSGFARQSGIDQEQQALLRALGPYLSRQRLEKLEKAMRAAKMARLASGLLGSGGLIL